jgi:hypothetical protein
VLSSIAVPHSALQFYLLLLVLLLLLLLLLLASNALTPTASNSNGCAAILRVARSACDEAATAAALFGGRSICSCVRTSSGGEGALYNTHH